MMDESSMLHAELRTSIISYLDDTVPVSMMTKSSSSSVTPSFVQNLIEGERENEEEDKDRIAQEELFAVVQQFRKGRGKGKSKGKGKGVCWNCGVGDHNSRDCRNDKQDSWTETMSWKGHQDSRISKGASQAWDTGKSNWNSDKGRGKEWQPRASVEARTEEASTALMELLKVTGGHHQTFPTLKKILISASWNIRKTS